VSPRLRVGHAPRPVSRSSALSRLPCAGPSLRHLPKHRRLERGSLELGTAEPLTATTSPDATLIRCGERRLEHEAAYLMPARRHDRTRMPNSKEVPARSSRTSSLSGSAEIDAMVARTAPAVLELLGDGIPRPRSAIIAALADRHPKEDVIRTLMRLAVTGQLVERERKYNLPPVSEEGEGSD
jgi:hypothetical protein